MKENKIFTPEQLENFVHEHIQQKIDNNELHLSLSRFDMKHPKAFKRSFQIYENALFEEQYPEEKYASVMVQEILPVKQTKKCSKNT